MALAGCAPVPIAPGAAAPSAYTCGFTREDARGSLRMSLGYDSDGTYAGGLTDWTITRDGVRIAIGWGGEPWTRPQDDNLVQVFLPGAPPRVSHSHGSLVMRFGREGSDEAGPASLYAMRDRGEYVGASTVGKLKALAAGGRVSVAAIDNGHILARGSFDPALLDLPRAMLAEVRGEVEAMHRDNPACSMSSDEDIVVT